jgi:uncharacterized membrane protein
VSLSEPATLLTDYLLATVAGALGLRLARDAPFRLDGRRLWAAAFLAGAVAALAGGTVHGFRGSLPPAVRAGLWVTYLIGVGLADGLLLFGIVMATLRGAWLRAGLAVTAAKLAFYLAVVTRSGLTRDAVGDAAATILLLLVLGLAAARRDPRLLGWMLLALGIAAVGLAVQAAGLAPHVQFNHNDACHVLLAVALLPFYRAGLRLRSPA